MEFRYPKRHKMITPFVTFDARCSKQVPRISLLGSRIVICTLSLHSEHCSIPKSWVILGLTQLHTPASSKAKMSRGLSRIWILPHLLFLVCNHIFNLCMYQILVRSSDLFLIQGHLHRILLLPTRPLQLLLFLSL